MMIQVVYKDIEEGHIVDSNHPDSISTKRIKFSNRSIDVSFKEKITPASRQRNMGLIHKIEEKVLHHGDKKHEQQYMYAFASFQTFLHSN